MSFSDEEYGRHHEAKKAALERVLGPMHNLVGHALIPFQMGGGFDMYYFPDGIPGTGLVTMELIEPDGSGPKPNRVGTYELVAFTKLTMPGSGASHDPEHPFYKVQRRICGLMTSLGRYAYEAVLNPGDTCDVPESEDGPYDFFMFDQYCPGGVEFVIGGRQHCLLLCLEVFESEMEYAREHGSDHILERLKAAGHYPYSDLDRAPVV